LGGRAFRGGRGPMANGAHGRRGGAGGGRAFPGAAGAGGAASPRRAGRRRWSTAPASVNRKHRPEAIGGGRTVPPWRLPWSPLRERNPGL
jgi:hypothetical protein